MQSVVVAVVRSLLTVETAKKLAHIFMAALAAGLAGAAARRLSGEKPQRPWSPPPRRLP